MVWLAGVFLASQFASSANPVALANPLPPGWIVASEHPLTIVRSDRSPVQVLVGSPMVSDVTPARLIEEIARDSTTWQLEQCQTTPIHADNDYLALRVCQIHSQAQVAIAIGMRRDDGQLQYLVGAAPAQDSGQLADKTLEVAAHVESGRFDGLLSGQDRPSESEPVRPPHSANAGDTEVHGVYAQWLSTGTAMYARPRVLFASGDILKDMSLPPSDVNVAPYGSRNRSDWGRWEISGNEYRIRWDDGSESNWSLDSNTFFPVHPAPAGLRLDGRFRAMTTMSVAEPQGGQLTTAAWSQITLSPDGRFVQGRGITTSGSNVAAYGIQPNEHGEYHIDGHLIELRFADGTVERVGFFIVAARDYAEQQPDVFGIGNTVFTRSR